MIKPTWPAFQMVFFDCDSTLSAIEGIDELAKSRGLFEEVQRLTNAAMDGEVHLESVYDKRLQLLRPTRGEIRHLERLYRENLVSDARQVIEALLFLQKAVFIVSGGLCPAVRPFGEWLGVPSDSIRAVEVKFNTLSGAWWDYHRDQWGERPDVNYLKHDESLLVQSTGKADVVRQLKRNLPGRSMLIGDGISDLAAKDEVDKLVGFGGVVARSAVAAGADIFITDKSLAPVLALATSLQERDQLCNTSHEAILQRGLRAITSGTVTFKKETWRQAVLEG
jgi:phosphoserine phosphatase